MCKVDRVAIKRIFWREVLESFVLFSSFSSGLREKELILEFAMTDEADKNESYDSDSSKPDKIFTLKKWNSGENLRL